MSGHTHTVGFAHRSIPTPVLTASGALAALVSCGLVGALLDVARGAPVRTLFMIGLALGAAVATGLVAHAFVGQTIVAVPLAYAAMLLLGGIFTHHGGFVTWLATAFITKAPVVLLATAAAVVVAAARFPRHH